MKTVAINSAAVNRELANIKAERSYSNNEAVSNRVKSSKELIYFIGGVIVVLGVLTLLGVNGVFSLY